MNKLLIVLQVALTTLLYSKNGLAQNRATDISSDIGFMFSKPFFDSRNINIIKLPHHHTYWTPNSELGLDLASWTDMNATLYVNNKPKCAVTLISRMWAVTTCLCLKNTPSTKISVRIGDPSMIGKVKHKFYKSDKIELHPQCLGSNNSYSSENDIALIQLSEPFLDSRYVFTAKLPDQLTYWTPDSTLSFDLAAYSDLKDTATSLKEAVWHTTSQLLNPEICLKKLNETHYVLGRNACSSYFHKNGVKNCELDLGASLSFDYILIGVLIYKDKCGEDEGAGSFVSIAMHSQWIRQTVRKNTPWIHL